MRGTPPLSTNNRFSCLEVEEYTSNLLDRPSSDVPTKQSKEKKPEKQKWELGLPKQYTLASTTSDKTLQIPIELRPMDSVGVLTTKALIDCGASDLFLDVNYIKEKGLSTKELTEPIPVRNVDGTPNEAGPIRRIAELLVSYKGHME
jgi:hypothetical protein